MTKRRCFISLILILLCWRGLNAQQPVAVVLRPGQPAPELNLRKILQAPPDAKSDLKSLHGKVVILEFWATWCAPCIEAQPLLNDLIEKYKDKPVQVISITNEDESKVSSFFKRRTLKGWVGLDLDRSVEKAYGVVSWPKTVVIDGQGNIVAETRANFLTAEKLDQLLAGNLPLFGPVASANQTAGNLAKSPPPTVKPDEPERALLAISVKPSKNSSGIMGGQPGRFQASGRDLRTVLSTLLGVAKSQIFVPAELNEKHYDILADIPNDKKRNMGPFLVSALEISLNMKVKHETRDVEVLVLTVPKDLTGSLQPTTSNTYHSSAAKGVLAAANADIKLLIRDLGNRVEAPIINETNLSGKYDWDFVFEEGNEASLIDAMRNQLGLVVTRAKRPVEVVVIEMEDK